MLCSACCINRLVHRNCVIWAGFPLKHTGNVKNGAYWTEVNNFGPDSQWEPNSSAFLWKSWAIRADRHTQKGQQIVLCTVSHFWSSLPYCLGELGNFVSSLISFFGVLKIPDEISVFSPDVDCVQFSFPRWNSRVWECQRIMDLLLFLPIPKAVTSTELWKWWLFLSTTVPKQKWKMVLSQGLGKS